MRLENDLHGWRVAIPLCDGKLRQAFAAFAAFVFIVIAPLIGFSLFPSVLPGSWISVIPFLFTLLAVGSLPLYWAFRSILPRELSLQTRGVQLCVSGRIGLKPVKRTLQLAHIQVAVDPVFLLVRTADRLRREPWTLTFTTSVGEKIPLTLQTDVSEMKELATLLNEKIAWAKGVEGLGRESIPQDLITRSSQINSRQSTE